ncbi:hypothetical protein VTJ04DRAFT_640 [Mycothermus thermophilus]|uniref:uncharacterized protein n=1 Tax=Humicola insolens TaxID=85995 RepID=UPI003742B9BB
MFPTTFKISFAILVAAGVASAVPKAGQPCDKPGSYNCLDDFKNVGVCSTMGRWEVAASCGGEDTKLIFGMFMAKSN